MPFSGFDLSKMPFIGDALSFVTNIANNITTMNMYEFIGIITILVAIVVIFYAISSMWKGE